jgi:hypothetical protein
MNMPSEFRDALQAAGGGPVEIVDGDEHYVLIRAETYARLKGLLDLDQHAPDEQQFLLQQWGKASGWEDPADEVFDSLEPK